MCDREREREREGERKTIRTLVAEEIYYGFIFLHAKQCKIIHDESATYFIA